MYREEFEEKCYNKIVKYTDLSLKWYIKFKIKVFQSISNRVFKHSSVKILDKM